MDWKQKLGNSFEAGFGMQSMTVDNQSVVVVLYIWIKKYFTFWDRKRFTEIFSATNQVNQHLVLDTVCDTNKLLDWMLCYILTENQFQCTKNLN
jgi:hypothetical protein